MRFDLHGHFWTIAPWLLHVVRPAAPPPASPFSVTIEDPRAGPVGLHGRIRHARGSKSLLIAVHGLGGNADSHYILAAAVAAEQAGLSCLRMNLRGAGGGAVDFYHAGLWSDLHAAIQAPELDRYERIGILGYSLGGHVTLRYASSGAVDARVRSVAAVCPPLDLDRGAAEIDKPERWVYRRHVLIGLKELLADVARRRPTPIGVREAMAIRSLREWDTRVVAPRFGFTSAEHYYAEESAGPRLHALARPALLVAAEADPMVPAHTLRPSLRDAPPALEVKWIADGGHVGFPKHVKVGEGATAVGLERQVIDWLQAR